MQCRTPKLANEHKGWFLPYHPWFQDFVTGVTRVTSTPTVLGLDKEVVEDSAIIPELAMDFVA